MFDDLVKTVKAQLYDRVSSPLFSCFLISWTGWNYKFILALISTMKVQDKLIFIDNVIYPGHNNVILHGFIFPLITALLIIYIYPYPAKITYKFYRHRQAELKEIQQAIDDETPLTKDEAKKIRSDALKMTINFEAEIERLQEENFSLRNIIKDKNKETELGSIKQDIPEKGGHEDGRPATDAIRTNDDEMSDYIPLFKGDKERESKRESRLLITGPEYIKSAMENFIREENVFEGHSFMIILKDEKLSINLLSKSGAGKVFEYPFNITSNNTVGLESKRIQRIFKDEFEKFILLKKPTNLDNE